MPDTEGDAPSTVHRQLPKVPPERTVCPANAQERVQSYGGGQQTALVTPSPSPTSGGSSICHTLAFTSIGSPLQISLQWSQLSEKLTDQGRAQSHPGSPRSQDMSFKVTWCSSVPPKGTKGQVEAFFFCVCFPESRLLEATSFTCQVHTALLTGMDQCD